MKEKRITMLDRVLAPRGWYEAVIQNRQRWSKIWEFFVDSNGDWVLRYDEANKDF